MNLHFHDLRMMDVSRLFETGLTIPQVGRVPVTGQWSSLNAIPTFAKLRQYADWKWLLSSLAQIVK